MINDQKIPCPICKSKIPFDITELLKGGKFSCPSCASIISIAQESRSQTEQAMRHYEELKQQHGKR